MNKLKKFEFKLSDSSRLTISFDDGSAYLIAIEVPEEREWHPTWVSNELRLNEKEFLNFMKIISRCEKLLLLK